MSLLREVQEGFGPPIVPVSGWNVGLLGDLGLLLSAEGFFARFNRHNLNLIFDLVEDGEEGQVRDHEGRIIEVEATDDGVILRPRNEDSVGFLLDHGTLKEMGIEAYEEEVEDAEPDSEFDPLEDDVTIKEGIKRAYRRQGKKIVRGYRVTSGFRKGRVVSSAKAAFKPRKKASTRMKLKLAARRKKVIRILKGKRTRRKSFSQRLVRMNKRVK